MTVDSVLLPTDDWRACSPDVLRLPLLLLCFCEGSLICSKKLSAMMMTRIKRPINSGSGVLRDPTLYPLSIQLIRSYLRAKRPICFFGGRYATVHYCRYLAGGPGCGPAPPLPGTVDSRTSGHSLRAANSFFRVARRPAPVLAGPGLGGPGPRAGQAGLGIHPPPGDPRFSN